MNIKACLSGFIFTVLLSLSHSVYGAGVTVMTHGFNGNVKDWVIPMANAVAKYPNLLLTNTSCYEIFFEQLSQGGYAPRQRKLSGGDPTTADSGEILVKLNWSQLSGGLSGVQYTTADIAPSVVSALLSTNFIPDLKGRSLTELPIHLVGHSRGGSLMCEISKLLGQEGVWVDHLTTLDPHPLNNDFDDSLVTTLVDAPARAYVNVLFADNYYQVNNSFLGIDPSGQFVVGAYNRRLSVAFGGYHIGTFTPAPNHGNAHLWYHGTIDWPTPASDTQATISGIDRQEWWTTQEVRGTASGFLYSLIGGGNRLSGEMPGGDTHQIKDGVNKIWDFGAGTLANRYALPKNTGSWPNLITLDVAATNLFDTASGRKAGVVSLGGVLPLSFRFQGGKPGSSNLSASFFLDGGLNPYSTNHIALHSTSLESTGVSSVRSSTVSLNVDSNLVPPGVYAVGGMIQDGLHKRYLYAPELLVVKASQERPVLEISRSLPDQIKVDVTAVAGQKLVIEATGDLLTWLPLETNTLSGAKWSFVADLNPKLGTQMYRARLLSQ